jgi:hypothetical protein
MTTELKAAAQELAESPHDLQLYYLIEHNAELRRRHERLRQENDELRHLLIKMRKRVAEVMHYSLDDFK